ncbi:MAG: hypothetical protein DSM107014_12085 [Gomphosphaeria aponina SAG 52.96 = DSM 107014]|uniref:Uncharacterized protein n=1 Tax=Gomphosphaeria aponina SAG 52.96 = DSM 107014 TaxID=1521640 RepID=A0A941GW76_9CHRO|nr:hypothetical protein [Gomphosphaeria aponina SAG 52.96 = DSM 107014]
MKLDNLDKKKKWWNLPVWGEKSILQKLLGILGAGKIIQGKREIDFETVGIHKQALAELRVLTPIAKALDDAKFTSREFKSFLEVKSNLIQGRGEYEGINNFIALLSGAIEAKDSFLKIEQIELSYRSLKQQEFYNYIFELLGKVYGEEKGRKGKPEKNLTKNEFYQEVQKKLDEVIPKIRTEEGKKALESYQKTLENLSKDKESLALKLLQLFKQYDLKDFSILKKISDMVIYLQDKNIENLNECLTLGKANQEIFGKLAQIIGLPESKREPKTYAIMLQYTALSYKHQGSYSQFARLIEVLQQWKSFYQSVISIREEYPRHEYNQPPEFTQEIPGEILYNKYKDYRGLV